MKNVKILMLMAVFMIATFGLTGCMKPPIVEKYEDVKNNETAFVVQLEGKEQAKLNSLESLRKLQVSVKRINISQRHKKTGRMYWQAKVIPTVTVLKVNRSPVTREWASGATAGTSSKNEGIWVESMDSIGFSTGFNCTARITEEDAATFLYLYPSDSLATVMDNQIRNEIQAVASEKAAEYKMDDCREKKLDIIQVVREQVIPKFAESGITITTIGMFGGFTYEDEEIQSSINATFVAQQEKVTSKAQLDAQKDKNATIVMAAEGMKNASITKAEGEAQAVVLSAEAKAKSIKMVAEAANTAASNPVFLELKKLEVEMERLKVWNGSYPQWVTGDAGGKLGIFVNTPQN